MPIYRSPSGSSRHRESSSKSGCRAGSVRSRRAANSRRTRRLSSPPRAGVSHGRRRSGLASAPGLRRRPRQPGPSSRRSIGRSMTSGDRRQPSSNGKIREKASHPGPDDRANLSLAGPSLPKARPARRHGEHRAEGIVVLDFNNPGREWQPERSPEQVRRQGLHRRGPGKAAPCGVYDQTADEGR